VEEDDQAVGGPAPPLHHQPVGLSTSISLSQNLATDECHSGGFSLCNSFRRMFF
jgi:hypothetical protein